LRAKQIGSLNTLAARPSLFPALHELQAQCKLDICAGIVLAEHGRGTQRARLDRRAFCYLEWLN
jgi:hypothetical protein